LYNRIRIELAVIREKFQDSLPAVKIKYARPFRMSQIEMRVDTSVLFDTLSGGGLILDSLNSICRLDTMYRYFRDDYRLLFVGRLNSARLVDIYASIPGEQRVWSSGRQPGDGPELLIWPGGQTFKYFFRSAWGDCPMGCLSSEVFYFTTKDGGIEFQGSYLSDLSNPNPRPPWWDTLHLAHDTTYYNNVWFADSSQAVAVF
jgi:hypothetical protein